MYTLIGRSLETIEECFSFRRVIQFGPIGVYIYFNASNPCITSHIKSSIRLPFIPGHEAVGVVTYTGAKTNFKVGDRVAVENHYYCGNCYMCDENRGDICVKMNQYGYGYGIRKRIRDTGVQLIQLRMWYITRWMQSVFKCSS